MANQVSSRSWIQIILQFLLGRKAPNEKLYAIHSYESTNLRKYLSFAENDDFELLDSMDQRWWRVKHLKTGRKGLVPSNYVAKTADKEIVEWVNLDCTALEAEQRLRQKNKSGKEKYESGAFLIRCPAEINNWQNLRLSVKHSSTIIRHYPIVREDSQFSITGDNNRRMSFPTLSKLVQYNARYSGGVTQRLIFSVKKKIDAWEIHKDEIFTDWNAEPLGGGHFGEVRLARLDGRHVALKTLILGRGMDKDQFIQEAVTARSLDHDNIVRTLGVCSAGPYIVTEFLHGGDLKNYLQRMKAGKRALTDNEYATAASKIASAMSHLEKNNVVHRDLAARNILVGQSLNTIKLADFGMARYLDDAIYYKTHKDVFPLKWTAPEAFVIIDNNDVIVQPGRSTSKSDVWSFAVVLWELYSMGANPYDGKNVREIYGYLMAENVPLECPTTCPYNSIYQLMLKCWSLAPADRPTFAQIVSYLDEYSAGKIMDLPKVVLCMLIYCSMSKVGAESYSCDRFKYELLKNHSSSIHSSKKYCCVVPQENFTNWSVLDRLSAVDNDEKSRKIFTDFSSITRSGHCIGLKGNRWSLKADWPKHIDCSQKFNIFFADVPKKIARPTHNMRLWDVIPETDVTFVSPIPGVLLKNQGCLGAGNISFAAGLNEAGDPILRSWTCSNIPKNILSYDSIFTIHVEDTAKITFYAKTVTQHTNFDTYANDSMTIIAGGHSNNNVNQIGGVYRINFNVDGNWQSRPVLVSSQVQFDPRNVHSKVQLRKHYKGQILTLPSGTNTESFIANYFEIVYRPHVFHASEFAQSDVHWSNSDSVIIDINIGEDNWSETREPEISCSNSTSRPLFAAASIHYELLPYLIVFIILTLVNIRVFATFCRRISREKTMKSCRKKALPQTPNSDDYDEYRRLPPSNESTTAV